MGQIINAHAKQTQSGRDYFIATIDIDSETNEGYCLEVGDGYTDGSTSFGHGNMAKTMATFLFEAVSNCADVLSAQLDTFETGDTQAFWNAFCEEFEDGWVYYDSDKDSIAYSIQDGKHGFSLMVNFIEKWHPNKNN